VTRLSGDEIRFGCVWNGFDYELQVWVANGIIQGCGHAQTMRSNGKPCCNAYRLAGQRILEVPNAQVRRPSKVIAQQRDGLSQTASRKTS
jgi:hypothetical protein